MENTSWQKCRENTIISKLDWFSLLSLNFILENEKFSLAEGNSLEAADFQIVSQAR